LPGKEIVLKLVFEVLGRTLEKKEYDLVECNV
jgi:hypothetical protein